MFLRVPNKISSRLDLFVAKIKPGYNSTEVTPASSKHNGLEWFPWQNVTYLADG